MKKTTITALSLASIVIASLTFSCKKEKTTATPEPTPTPVSNPEYIADSTTFLSFSTWTIQATSHGPSPSLGMAHAGNDSTVIRQVHFKNGQYPSNGKYPVGTVIVKHSTNPAGSVNELTAMVKRGNNFNPNTGDWEFFMLMPDGKIAKDGSGNPMRGAALMGGMCGSCHAQVAYKDYIFSK